jgi:hypothetical protein
MTTRNTYRKMSKSEAGKVGGLARQRLYGNLGTPDGRRKGGLHSLATHSLRNTGFNTLQKVEKPKHSKDLAEFLGIMYGDGHVGMYQATMTTHSVTDVEHARHVATLAQKIFKLKPSFVMKRGVKACTVTLNSKQVCEYLAAEGMARGNKLALGLKIPLWVSRNPTYTKAFTRGLFDTDGCVFLDKHRIKGKLYKNMGLAFSSRSKELLKHFTTVLISIGCHPTQTTPHGVFLRRAKEIDLYFKVIGSSNPKHVRRYSEYSRLIHGGVA